MGPVSPDVTSLLKKLAEGNRDAADQLIPVIYQELHQLAAGHLRHERPDHTLQATALLHEALLRVLKQPESSWRNKAHLISFAGRAMRRILISYGVARTRDKRGGRQLVKLPLDEVLDFCVEKNIHIVAVDEAVEELAQVDPRQAQIVELRFFAGLTIEEIAKTLALSPATVKRDWATAKLWLRARLAEG